MSRLSRPGSRPDLVIAMSVIGLYLLAVAVRAYAAAQLPFPATEAAAYYAGVAQHIVSGAGIVSDAVWSYATPPLVAPKPAFELWMPLSSLVSAAAMTVLGHGYGAAQVASVLLGAAMAPLAWVIARAAAGAGGLAPRRVAAIALTTGILTALLAPFVLNSAVPDSYTPFTVTALAAAILVPAALGLPSRAGEPGRRPSRWVGLGLGILLGLCYLSRQEAVWLGLVVLATLVTASASAASGTRLREISTRLWPIVAGGLIVVVPWLVRNTLELGSPFPGQTVENLFLLRNEDIFAYGERPSASAYLSQDLGTLVGNPIAAAGSALSEALLFPAFPIGVVGLVSIVGLWRSPSLRHPTALKILLLSGGLTFLATVLLFPVASRWGTYLHASGPFLVGLTATAVLGSDALVAKISRWRGWPKANVVIGPAALVLVTVALGVLQLGFLADQARTRQIRYEAIERSLAEIARRSDLPVPGTLMTDHPMWLATITGKPAIALPDEDPASVVALGRQFGTNWLVVIEERGRYPGVLLEDSASDCLVAEPLPLVEAGEPAWLFRLAETCPS